MSTFWSRVKSAFSRTPQVRQDDNFNGLISTGPGRAGGGLVNLATGLGTFGRDKVMQGAYYDGFRIVDPELCALFHFNDMAARIVELKPKEMFRRGYQLVLPSPDGTTDQDENSELAEQIELYGAKLKLNDIMCEGMIWGRLFGGDLVIVGADDGLDPSLPLNEENIRSIKFLNNVDRRFIFARTYYQDPFSPKFGEVETYQITNSFGGGDGMQAIVHESRVIRFDGAPVEVLKKKSLAGWTLSVLQRPYDTLRQFDSSFQAVSNLMVDASQGVFKMKGLIDMISSGDAQTLQTRMAMVDMSRSTARAVLLDAETEDFERKPTTFNGLPDMLDRFMQRLASTAEMPVTILFGRSPAGLNATGEADFRYFYDSIATDQKNKLQPRLLRIYRLICLAKDGPTGGVEPEGGIEINFHPLWQPSEMEQAQLELAVGQRDVAYVTAGILLPEEVALSRFKAGEFQMTTEIDVDARKQSMAASVDLMVQQSEALAQHGPILPETGEPESPEGDGGTKTGSA